VNGLPAAIGRAALADRSELGRLIGTGPDLLGLLHRLSTGDVSGLQPGEGRATVLTSAKGRIVEWLSVHHLGEGGVLLVAGPHAAARVLSHLKKYTFAERTELADVTEDTFAFALVGPRWPESAIAAALPALAPYGVATSAVAGARVHAARTNGFDADGLLVVGRRDDAGAVRAALLAAVASVEGGAIDAAGFEAWRITRGLPAPGHELTEEHNPLEAGLLDAISFTKGCYVGQEVVARLNTYDRVSRKLVRLTLPAGVPAPAAGAVVSHAGSPIGVITSAIVPPGETASVALAYVKTRELPKGVGRVTVDVSGEPREATIGGA